jgi:hypothetical protein
MNLSPTALFIDVIVGAVGVGYFVYGRKQARMAPMLSGAALCVVPYFVGNIWLLLLVCAALLAAPFLVG